MSVGYLLVDNGAGPLKCDQDILIGRSADANLVFADDMTCSRRQALVRAYGDHCEIESLSQSTPTYLNDQEITGRVRLRDGDEVRFGAQRITYHEREVTDGPPSRSASGPAPDPSHTVMAGSTIANAAPLVRDSSQISIRDGLILGRSEPAAEYVLDHPTVSRQHAQISVANLQVSIRDLGSTNGTFVNGDRVLRPVVINSGDRVDIGPFSLIVEGDYLVARARTGHAAITAFDLALDVKANGKPLRILDSVTLAIEAKEFVCIVGPSGSGKTTLMRILAGRATPTAGVVGINDLNLHENFQSIKQDMAMVPQHDVLHENLSLKSALNYTAMLRLPKDTDAATRKRTVEQAAEDVDLAHRLDTKIGQLSGGQKKRASLASETLSGPSLLFLDEVTSGLDEATDREIMRLLRRKADNGMTVICVTHTLANVEDFCHKLIIMGEGGGLAFIGPPADALNHFGVTRLGEIFDRLKERPVAYWRDKLSVPMPGKRPEPSATGVGGRAAAQAKTPFELGTALRQYLILTRRNLDLLRADRRGLIMAAVQSILIGSLIGYAFIDFGVEQAAITAKNALLLLLGLCAIWLGCNSASQDIVGELPIFRRENDVNLSAASFVLSKFTVSGLFTMLQIVVVFLLVWLFADAMPGRPLDQLSLLLIGALAGTSMGLLISSLAKTNEQATTIVPLALVPQLILAGVLVPKLPEFADAIAKVAVSGFWLTEGMKANLIDAEGPIQLFDPTNNGVILMEAEPSLLAGVMIGVHCLVFLVVAYLAVILATRQR